MAYPHGRASVSTRNPRAFGICDRCGFTYNHDSLVWQYQWVGPRLQNLRILVCQTCLDVPQEQLRTIVLPPDPIPIANPRPPRYSVQVPSYITTQGTVDTLGDRSGQLRLVTEDGDPIVTEIRDTPTPDPENPVIYP